MENRLMELWSLLSIVAPGLYAYPQQFTELVAVPVEKLGDADALQRFRRRIRPFLLRRTKELVAADLPPKQEQVLEVQLTPKHRRVYDTHLQRERQNVLGSGRRVRQASDRDLQVVDQAAPAESRRVADRRGV